jgi:hypothetical protein
MTNRPSRDFWDQSRCYFCDDFVTSSYDTRTWYANGSGSVAILTPGIGGVLKLTAANNNANSLHFNNAAAFSVASRFDESIRFKLPVITSIALCIGMISTGVQYAALRLGATNFTALTLDGNGNTENDTGVAIDTNWHDLRIRVVAAGIEFWLDGRLCSTNTTNLPVEDLQPYLYVQSLMSATRDLYVDYVIAEGDRA